MKIPFSVDEFFNVFKAYNQSIWPFQILLYLLAVVCVIFAMRKTPRSGAISFSILTLLWLWMGLVYHILFFSAINNAAYLFGFAFIIESLILLYAGVIKHNFEFEFVFDFSGFLGITLIVYALVVYPILSFVSGKVYPATPTFGVPCPTTIFTFAILLFSKYRVPWFVILIPFLWSVVGFSAAIHLSVKEDFGLFIAGVFSTIWLSYFKPAQPSKLKHNNT